MGASGATGPFTVSSFRYRIRWTANDMATDTLWELRREREAADRRLEGRVARLARISEALPVEVPK